VSTEPLSEFGPRAKLVNRLTGGRLQHLFVGQIVVVARSGGSPTGG
jgi:hypothetical protein